MEIGMEIQAEDNSLSPCMKHILEDLLAWPAPTVPPMRPLKFKNFLVVRNSEELLCRLARRPTGGAGENERTIIRRFPPRFVFPKDTSTTPSQSLLQKATLHPPFGGLGLICHRAKQWLSMAIMQKHMCLPASESDSSEGSSRTSSSEDSDAPTSSPSKQRPRKEWRRKPEGRDKDAESPPPPPYSPRPPPPVTELGIQPPLSPLLPLPPTLPALRMPIRQTFWDDKNKYLFVVQKNETNYAIFSN